MVLDTDLAAFYGETTKRFNQQVSRNLSRFLSGFTFWLNEQEFADLRLQFATSSLNGGHGGRRYAPLAFTEHGAIMASMVLNSPRATELSVYVVQAFVELRGMLASSQELAGKVNTLVNCWQPQRLHPNALSDFYRWRAQKTNPQALAAPARAGLVQGLVLFRFKRGNDSWQQGSCLKEWPAVTGYIVTRNLISNVVVMVYTERPNVPHVMSLRKRSFSEDSLVPKLSRS